MELQHLLPLMALVAPFLVLIVEWFLPYPHIVEELAKLSLIFALLNTPGKQQIKLAILLGGLFAVSETVLYYLNFLLLDSLMPLFIRLLLTATLHISTMLTILLLIRFNQRLWVLGLLLAIFIHFAYNLVFF